ncbi:MAG TPA: YciI family protein [Streptosporangiaceae bacterium]|nr:YciI family protein [Streptosporangiaceae bacterium]
MKYLFLLYGEPIPPAGTPEARKLLADWTAARQEMEEAGVLLGCAPLYPPDASTTVRVRDGAVLLTDGPAAEIKEQFGGYTLVDCANLDEALAWAAKIPTAREGTVEVRPVIEVPGAGG